VNAEDWKTLISVVSAVVAVVSAVLAHRARIQTRTDIFESQRDALILAMADNDSRCSQLALQSALARDELGRIAQKVKNPSDQKQVDAFLENLAELDKLTKSLDGREYNAKNLDTLSYSEDALVTLRRMARGEQVNSKLLGPASYDLVFKLIERFVARCD